jgi:sulfite reductase beta subunit-like hemoprotein
MRHRRTLLVDPAILRGLAKGDKQGSGGWKLEHRERSEEEYIKDAGLVLDFDELAKKGVMSKEEKLIGKWYGIYASRQPGAHMARVVIPGGSLSTSRARNIAEVAEEYGQGKINVTTRQALQFHWLKIPQLPEVLRKLAEEGNSTFHGCGDVTRTIAACPLAENCVHARLNVRPWAERTMKALTDDRELDNLPRKFKISYSGCQAGCAQPYMNCVGNIAVQVPVDGENRRGFRVVIGGGMGWMAFVAQELFSFVPEEQIVAVNRAIAQLYRDHGDRYNRQKSRLKFVVDRQGIEFCRSVVLKNLKAEKISTAALRWEPLVDNGPSIPERPLTEENPVGSDGKATVRARIWLGELDYKQFLALAELADIYGDQRLYTTNRQNIEIRGVEPKHIAKVRKEIEAIGFPSDGFFGLRDIIPCVGTTYCPKAVGTTRNLHDLLQPVVNDPAYKEIEKFALINITGCPNSCVPYRIADIGFRGMRIREADEGSVIGYEMLIGGDQQAHGQKLGEFKESDIPGIVRLVLDTFKALRQNDETLTGLVQRVGLEPFSKAVLQ